MMEFEPGPYYLIQFNEKALLGISLKNIKGVYPIGEITLLPNQITNIVGMANLEGNIVLVQDTFSLLGNTDDFKKDSYILLLNTYLGEVGLLIPSKFQETTISKEQIDTGIKGDKNLLNIILENQKIILVDLNIPFKFGDIIKGIKKISA